MLRVMSLLLFAEVNRMLHTASHTFWCLRGDVYSSRMDMLFKVSLAPGRVWYTTEFSWPHKEKSAGVRSGDFGGHSIVTQRAAHKPGKKYNQFWTSSTKLVGAAFCKTEVQLWMKFPPDKMPRHRSTTGDIVRRSLVLPGVFPWIVHHTVFLGLVRWWASLRREDYPAPSVQSSVNMWK